MITKKVALTLSMMALVAALGAGTVGIVLAQTTTPPTEVAPGATTPDSTSRTRPDGLGLGRSLGFRSGDSATYDLLAEKLGLTPTELFEQLHDGKTLAEIAEAQGVDPQAIQDEIRDELKATRVQAMKDKIAQAVTDGDMTQEEADWWLLGIEKGWVDGGRGDLGSFGPHGRHGMGDRLEMDGRGMPPDAAPATGTSS